MDYGAVIGFKQPLLARAAKNFEARASQAQRDDYAAFCARHAGWLDDFALFMALKNEHGGLLRERDSLRHRESRLREELDAPSVMAEQLVTDVSECQTRLTEIVESLQATQGGKDSAAGRLSVLLGRRSDAEKRTESARVELVRLREDWLGGLP